MATVTTLPATFVSGAVLTAAQQNDLRGAFRVLQVVTGTTLNQETSTSTTYADTQLTQTITPSSTSSKILVFVTHPNCYKSAANSGNAINMLLFRDATAVLQATNNVGFTGTALDLYFGIAFSYMDSPASTSAIVYKTQFANRLGAASVSVQQDGVMSQIILMEISA